jgi:hypothetical protein
MMPKSSRPFSQLLPSLLARFGLFFMRYKIYAKRTQMPICILSTQATSQNEIPRRI